MRMKRKAQKSPIWTIMVDGPDGQVEVDIPGSDDLNRKSMKKDDAIELGCALIRAAGCDVDYWETR